MVSKKAEKKTSYATARSQQLVTFRNALLKATKKTTLSSSERNVLESAATVAKRPRLWSAMERLVANAYQRKTGVHIAETGFDWGKILQWLADNLPAIIALIVKLIALFG